jgi:hypothetical protein
MIKSDEIVRILHNNLYTKFCCGDSEIAPDSIQSAANDIYSEIVKERQKLGKMIIDIYFSLFPNWTFTDIDQAASHIINELKTRKSDYNPEW